MNLDELRSVQSKERSKDSLQHLRESFYADVATYVQDLRDERDAIAAEVDNPFDSDEISRLSDEIATAEEVVEALYERRVGKIVKRASIAAAGMAVDEDGLTSEEQQLYDDLVSRIRSNKERVLDVLAGEIPAEADPGSAGSAPADAGATGPTTGSAEGGTGAEGDAGDPPAPPADDGVGAADVMGGASDAPTPPPNTPDPEAGGPSETPTAEAGSEEVDEGDGSDVERTTVRITRDVGDIFGVDQREYSLEREDVVTLPAANADPLVEREAAERLD